MGFLPAGDVCGSAGMTRGAGDEGRRVTAERGGSAAIEGSEGRRKVRAWLMRWWSHGFLPAQE